METGSQRQTLKHNTRPIRSVPTVRTITNAKHGVFQRVLFQNLVVENQSATNSLKLTMELVVDWKKSTKCFFTEIAWVIETLTTVQIVNSLHLLGRQFKIEYVQVFHEPFRILRFGND